MESSKFSLVIESRLLLLLLQAPPYYGPPVQLYPRASFWPFRAARARFSTPLRFLFDRLTPTLTVDNERSLVQRLVASTTRRILRGSLPLIHAHSTCCLYPNISNATGSNSDDERWWRSAESDRSSFSAVTELVSITLFVSPRWSAAAVVIVVRSLTEATTSAPEPSCMCLYSTDRQRVQWEKEGHKEKEKLMRTTCLSIDSLSIAACTSPVNWVTVS